MATKQVFRLFTSLALIVFAATSLFSADSPPQKAGQSTVRPAQRAPVYGAGETELPVTSAPEGRAMTVLGQTATNAVGTQIGTTTYDMQQSCSMGRQVEHRGTSYLHFGWTRQLDDRYSGYRRIAYQAYNLTTCGFVLPNDTLVTTNYAGYASVDAAQSGLAIIAGNVRIGANPHRSQSFWDIFLGHPMGQFMPDGPTDIFGWYWNDGTGPDNPNLWPKIEWQVGTETVLHMVATELPGQSGEPSTISYYRRVGGYGSTGAVWSAQRIIDTVMTYSPTVAASPTSDKVAIVWNAPIEILPVGQWDQYQNDIWYAVSSTQGADWIAGIGNGSIAHDVETGPLSGSNITHYTTGSPYKAFADLSALIDSDDNLHIVWGCRHWTNPYVMLEPRNAAIFHWSENVPYIRPVVTAVWDSNGSCQLPAWSGNVAKMSLSECDGKLYVLFTQFGSPSAVCYDVAATTNVVNGELYLTGSDDGGLIWDRPQNLTNSVTPNCAPGDCESDYWASMARYGRVESCGGQAGQNVLDILYINDRSAGSVVSEESGIWTVNPVMWLATPCRPLVPEPGYADNAGGGLCNYGGDQSMLFVPYQGKDTIYFMMENPGMVNNNFTIGVEYMDGDGWLEVKPPAGTIPTGLYNMVEVRIIGSDPRTTPYDPFQWEAVLTVTHQAEGSPHRIPVCLWGYEAGADPTATLATACSRIRVYGSGRLVNDIDDAALDFIDDCDTFNVQTRSKIYLYDGSPVICRINPSDASDTLRFMMNSGNSIYSDDALRPDGDSFAVDSTGNPGYTVATAKFATADQTIGMTAEYYIPKNADSCSFVIQKFQVNNLTETPLKGICVGEILDWDIPSDSGVNNGSGYDEDLGVIYQFGAEYNQDDSTEALCPQESNDRFGAIARLEPRLPFKNAMTLDNATYLYTSGPYGSQAPFPPGVTYRLMADRYGYSLFQSADPDSQYVDLSTLVTFDRFDLYPGGSACFSAVLVNSKMGLVYLTDQIEKARAFADNYGIWCDCCRHPGNATWRPYEPLDGVDVGDAVFIINYVFKFGPHAYCRSEADANGDGTVNIGDAVYIINYIFKGGSAPICGP